MAILKTEVTRKQSTPKNWHALFSCHLCFEFFPSALSQTVLPFVSTRKERIFFYTSWFHELPGSPRSFIIRPKSCRKKFGISFNPKLQISFLNENWSGQYSRIIQTKPTTRKSISRKFLFIIARANSSSC